MAPEVNPSDAGGVPAGTVSPPPDTGGSGSGTSGSGSSGSGSTSGTTSSSGNYTVISQRHTVQQLSSGNVVDVESVGFQTKPHGVYCEVLVPYATWQAGGSATYINPVATAIESLMGNQPVASASFAQDVDTSTNLLADFVDFIVVYTAPGGIAAMSTTVRVSVASLAQGAAGLPTAQIQAAYASLKHTASL